MALREATARLDAIQPVQDDERWSPEAADDPALAERRAYAACDDVIALTAAFFGTPARELRRPGRCADDISRVRQIAMYVAHTVLRISMRDVGRGFGRDRTTVMYACHLVEDLRDDSEFDAVVVRMENVVRAAFRIGEAV